MRKQEEFRRTTADGGRRKGQGKRTRRRRRGRRKEKEKDKEKEMEKDKEKEKQKERRRRRSLVAKPAVARAPACTRRSCVRACAL